MSAGDEQVGSCDDETHVTCGCCRQRVTATVVAESQRVELPKIEGALLRVGGVKNMAGNRVAAALAVYHFAAQGSIEGVCAETKSEIFHDCG